MALSRLVILLLVSAVAASCSPVKQRSAVIHDPETDSLYTATAQIIRRHIVGPGERPDRTEDTVIVVARAWRTLEEAIYPERESEDEDLSELFPHLIRAPRIAFRVREDIDAPTLYERVCSSHGVTTFDEYDARDFALVIDAVIMSGPAAPNDGIRLIRAGLIIIGGGEDNFCSSAAINRSRGNRE